MSHKLVTRNPMSEARRQHVHGKLVSLAEQAREAGEPSWATGAGLLIGLFIILAISVAAIGGIQ